MSLPRAVTAASVMAIALAVVLPLLLLSRPMAASGAPASLLGADEIPLQGGLPAGRTLVQQVGPVADGLSEVSVYGITSYHRSLSPVVLRVLESETELRRVVSTSEPAGGPLEQQLRFRFAEIPDSGRRHLSVELTSPAASTDSAWTLFVVRADGSSPSLLSDSQPLDVVLPARLRFGADRPVIDQVGAAVDRASQFRPQPLKQAGIVVVGLLALIAALALVMGLATVPTGTNPD